MAYETVIRIFWLSILMFFFGLGWLAYRRLSPEGESKIPISPDIGHTAINRCRVSCLCICSGNCPDLKKRRPLPPERPA